MGQHRDWSVSHWVEGTVLVIPGFKKIGSGGSCFIFDIWNQDIFLVPFSDVSQCLVLMCELFSFSFVVNSGSGERLN